MLSALLQLHLTTPFLPLSLNSLDLAGVRLLSSRDSPDTSKQLQVPMIPVQMTQLSSSGSSMKILFVVLFHFLLINSGAQLGRSGIFCIRGSLLLFWFVVRPWLYLGDVMLYSCIVWSGDCKPTLVIPFLFITWDCVKMTLLATIPTMRLYL